MDCRTQPASLANDELDKRDFNMAIEILRSRLKDEPNNYELYFERSICNFKLGNYQESLDDANAAIRLNPDNYVIHYQKGLTLYRLKDLAEGVTSIKKAIELRARMQETKLSDIFNLLRDSSKEHNAARDQQKQEQQLKTNLSQGCPRVDASISQTDVIDSTNRVGLNREAAQINTNGNNFLVGNNNSCNNFIQPTTTPSQNNKMASNQKVSCSTSHKDNGHSLHNHQHHPFSSSLNQANPSTSTANGDSNPISAVTAHMQSLQQPDQLRGSQLDWNIRRSERIFLHSSDQPQFGPVPNTSPTPRSKQGSNPSSLTSSNARTGLAVKRSREETLNDSSVYPTQPKIQPDNNSTVAESDIDVDDSYNNNHPVPMNYLPTENPPTTSSKRVLVAPSSSMPAASSATSITNRSLTNFSDKEGSYSTKYKRARRDRERARRGTTKLCTIKLCDLEDLEKSLPGKQKSMRVIAPIDGWLYSGQLLLDGNQSDAGSAKYVVKLDGDSAGVNYVFNKETVLSDVIKEVRVQSVSELRKGARICCYWSRQYKCLSTGVVTSRTFEATKSLVSVKYDNGDLSALPLEDLRLLPPDFPKYMSNCDPLLLARNGDGSAPNVIGNDNAKSNNFGNSNLSEPTLIKNSDRVLVTCHAPIIIANGAPKSSSVTQLADTMSVDGQTKRVDPATLIPAMVPKAPTFAAASIGSMKSEVDLSRNKFTDDDQTDEELNCFSGREDVRRELDKIVKSVKDLDEDPTIPTTDETINFITNDASLSPENIAHHFIDSPVDDRHSPSSSTPKNLSSQDGQFGSRVSDVTTVRQSTDINLVGLEYKPWTFEGPPKKSKRYGRHYRGHYNAIRRGNELIRVGDSAELMPRDESILPFIGKIDRIWATTRGEMRVRVRWYYRLVETEGDPYDLPDGDNALFETDHFDENDVQSIYRSTRILSWTEYNQNHRGYVNQEASPKIFYLAGYYDPVRLKKHLRDDIDKAR